MEKILSKKKAWTYAICKEHDQILVIKNIIAKWKAAEGDEKNRITAEWDDAKQNYLNQQNATRAAKTDWENAVNENHIQLLNKNILNFMDQRKLQCNKNCKGCEQCMCTNDDCPKKGVNCDGDCFVCRHCREEYCGNYACYDMGRLESHPWEPCEYCNDICCGRCERCKRCCKGYCSRDCPRGQSLELCTRCNEYICVC